VLATFHMPLWRAAPSLGPVFLGSALGWTGAVAFQLALFALIALATLWVESRRGVTPQGRSPVDVWRRLWQGPWPFLAGGVALAVLNAATLVLSGQPWGVTWAFTLWGGKALQAVGYDLSRVAYWRGEFEQAALAAPLLADVTTVMNLGLVLGAVLGAGLAGRFALARRVPLRIVAASLLGGILMGYGARLSFGCNIGAYFSGIASTSLHGWLWLAAALFATPLGVELRALFGVEQRKPGASPR
jgi:hypothetical protein